MPRNYNALDIPPIVVGSEMRAEMGKFNSLERRKAEQQVKPDHCLLCGEPQTSFCNSHTLPAFCLESIAGNGHVLSIADAIGTNIVESSIGLNRAGTFRLVCRKCDNEFFKEYESRSSYGRSPTQQILGKIAVKCCLSELAKSRRDSAMYGNLAEEYPVARLSVTANARDLSVHDDERNLRKALLAASGGNRTYKLLLFRRLEYVTPVAFQTMVTPIVDLEGKLINNLFDPEPTAVVEPLFLCCFPMGDCSVVISFRHRRTARFDSFDRQISSLAEEDKLLVLLKLVLAYSDEVFFAPAIGNVIRNEAGIGALCRMNIDSLGVRPRTPNRQLGLLAIREAAMSKYALKAMPDIPNLLSPDYSLG
ncbi:MAG: hypothetical protein IKG22_00885 [Atopobiaceae bacterium]|nr:hypothetical protein [Atopobiaceae bacterium]